MSNKTWNQKPPAVLVKPRSLSSLGSGFAICLSAFCMTCGCAPKEEAQTQDSDGLAKPHVKEGEAPREVREQILGSAGNVPVVAGSPKEQQEPDHANVLPPDLSPVGWERDASLLGIQIDGYRPKSGTLHIDLLAFPSTSLTAAQWMEDFLAIVEENGKDLKRTIHTINEDELGTVSAKGPLNTSSPGVDMATRTLMVLRPGEGKSTFAALRAIVRENQPVQLSLMVLGENRASVEELEQVSQIRMKANLPINESAAFLGLDSMVAVMFEPLLLPRESRIHVAQKEEAQKKAEDAGVVLDPEVHRSDPGSHKSLAPKFAPLPGPQVRVTGEMLRALPAGYRMNVRTTNYWTSASLDSTRRTYFTLTKDGQFEWGSYSISGGIGGMASTVHTSDKKGSVGSVFGDTNPGGPGIKSVALNTREGLDTSKYGTYFISGHQLRLLYANGKREERSFRTDGYKTLIINDKKFFVGTPKGWQRSDHGKVSVYRSLDGAYRARVNPLEKEIEDGRRWMKDFLARMQSKKLMVSAGPVQAFKGGFSNYEVVKATGTMPNKDGSTYSQDFYLKFGRFERRFIQLDRFEGADGEERVLEFVQYLD